MAAIVWGKREISSLVVLTLVAGLICAGQDLGAEGEGMPSDWPAITLARRDVGSGDFDNLIGEFRSKGGRMRFGKRSASLPVNPYLRYWQSNTGNEMGSYIPRRMINRLIMG